MRSEYKKRIFGTIQSRNEGAGHLYLLFTGQSLEIDCTREGNMCVERSLLLAKGTSFRDLKRDSGQLSKMNT